MDAQKVYDKFVKDRNLALEKILNRYRSIVAQEVAIALRSIYFVYKMHTPKSHALMDHIVMTAAYNVENQIKRMRRQVRILTVASEYEILARIGKSQKTDPVHIAYGKEERHFKAGGSIAARVAYYLNNIIRRLDSLSELAQVKGESLSAEEIGSVFPKLKRVSKKKVIRRLTEADQNSDEKFSITTDFVSDAEWQSLIQDYKEEFILQDRSGSTGLTDEEMTDAGLFPSGTINAAGESVTYDWELERDLTHDFIEQVRDGQIEAANEAGVDDFVWIAIIDDVTDQCCRWRDGLTSEEIQAQLKAHGNDCEGAIVPPAHFNCRCDVAPKLKNMPDVPESMRGDFEEWLNS